MNNNSKYPPSKKSGLMPGDKVIVRNPFVCCDTHFEEGEILVFDSEMHDVYDSCDCWVFAVAGSKMQKKIIMGYKEFKKPKKWIKYLVKFDQDIGR